jgi:WD40 repeat protein
VQFVPSLAFARDGTLLACATSDFNVRLWCPATGEEIGLLQGHEHNISALAFSADGRLLASGDDCGVVRLWDVTSKELLTTPIAPEDKFVKAVAVAFAPDGRTFAVAVDRTVRLWDVTTGQCVARLEGHEGNVICLAYSPDGTRLASGSYDRTVRLWDVACYRARIHAP